MSPATVVRHRRRLPSALVGLVAAVLVSGVLVAAPAIAAVPSSWVFSGHGWGHGRGMGQYGAFGYATRHGWDYTAILRHFYGGTQLAGDAGDPPIRVALVSQNGQDTIVQGDSLRVQNWATGQDVFAGGTTLRVALTGPGTMRVFHGPGCAGPWTPYPGPAWATPQVNLSNDTGPITVCKGGGSAAYRGQIMAFDAGTRQVTINYTRLQDYLQGVVPRESLDAWGSAAGGAGMHALRAQAVAARSYALASSYAPYADTCDTTSCQVYGGVSTGTPNSDRAVAETVGQVMRHGNGAIARTEFSSSTGGWTAGGTFPAVVDEGDVVSPNHDWTETVSAARLAAGLGVSDVQTLRVTSRNGLGADGGRVLTVAGTTSSGATFTRTGAQVRSGLGLLSDWFTPIPTGGCAAVPCTAFVTALYHDFLFRAPDAGGLGYWVAALDAGRTTVRSTATGFARSPEYIGFRLDQLYLAVLGRPVDAAARAHYTGLIGSGTPLSGVVATVAASPEAAARYGQGSTQAWVRGMYPVLIGRDADEAGVAYWSGQVAARGRVAVAGDLYLSLEARRGRVAWFYAHLLGRTADDGGLGYYAGQLPGWGEFDVPAVLASSQEYIDRAAARFPG